jgi:hypothetical protein
MDSAEEWRTDWLKYIFFQVYHVSPAHLFVLVVRVDAIRLWSRRTGLFLIYYILRVLAYRMNWRRLNHRPDKNMSRINKTSLTPKRRR